jgi:hypothetical protein
MSQEAEQGRLPRTLFPTSLRDRMCDKSRLSRRVFSAGFRESDPREGIHVCKHWKNRAVITMPLNHDFIRSSRACDYLVPASLPHLRTPGLYRHSISCSYYDGHEGVRGVSAAQLLCAKGAASDSGRSIPYVSRFKSYKYCKASRSRY